MKEFLIRESTPEDAEELAAFRVASWRSAYKGIVPDEYLAALSTEGRAEKFLRNLTELKNWAYYSATCGGRIVGTLSVGKSFDEDKPNAGEVGSIYLLEEFWGKGYGRQLMRHGLEALRRMGYREAVLWVFERNARARRFYEKCGFVADGAKKEVTYGKPLVEIRYALTIECEMIPIDLG